MDTPEASRCTDDLYFYFGPLTQYCMGLSSYGPKTPGWRNRLTLLVAQSMTCSSPSKIRLLTTIPTEMSVVDQELSIDMFISTARPLQKKVGTRLTKRTVPTKSCAVPWSPLSQLSSSSCYLSFGFDLFIFVMIFISGCYCKSTPRPNWWCYHRS